RTLTDKYNMVDQGSIDLTSVFLDRDIVFTVASGQEARDIEEADPSFTKLREVDVEWEVTRLKGATARVPRELAFTRAVSGHVPDHFDAASWGMPVPMLDALDRMAVWNLVTALDAFSHAVFSPSELLQVIHPGQVATTQGTGI